MSSEFVASPQRFRFGKASEAIPAGQTIAQEETSSTAMKLLVLFLMLMYSSIGALYPAVEVVRPAMTVAIGAIFFTILEVSRRGGGFRMSWPEGTMIIALLGVSTVSTFSAIYLRQAAETTLTFAKVVLIYVVVENIVTTPGRLRKMMLTMVIGGLIPAFGTIYNYLAGHLVEGTRAGFAGNFANPNEDAYGLIILVPLAIAIGLRSGWFMRILLAASLLVILLAVYLTFSRGGLLGLVVVLGLLGWKQKSFVVKAMMIAMLAGGIVVVSMFWTRNSGDFSDMKQDVTVNQRLATYRAGLEMFRDKPILGVGPGCSLVAYPLYVPKALHCGCQDQLVVHNAFIQILSETGALGVIPFLILIGAALFHAWRLQHIQDPELQTYAMGLELALWGFVLCGLSGGFAWSWFPYLLAGMVAAARQMAHVE